MNKYRVEVSGEAKNNISEIYFYIRNTLCNNSAAESYIDDTIKAIESLENFPYAHMVRPGSKRIGKYEKRQYFYRENYCFFYIIIEESKTVRIIKVAHTETDLDKLETL